MTLNRAIWHHLEKAKRFIDLENASDAAKLWWCELEELNYSQPHLILKLVESLASRGATIEDYFIICSNSKHFSAEENLRHLDNIQREKEISIKHTELDTIRFAQMYH
jgi:hypothetical protein